MEDIEQLFLQNDKQKLKITKNMKDKIRQYFKNNSDKIKQLLLACKSVDSQILVVDTLLKTLNKDEIAQNTLFKEYSVQLSHVSKNNYSKLLDFLFNFNLNPCSQISGARIENVKLPNKEIIGGFIFIGDNSFRIQKDNEIVIIFFKSIVNVKMRGVDLEIDATENRTIIIKLKYNQDFEKFKRHVSMNFYELEAQDSIILDIGKKSHFFSKRRCITSYY